MEMFIGNSLKSHSFANVTLPCTGQKYPGEGKLARTSNY